MTILIKGGHVINPATQMDEVADVLIKDQKIKKIGKELPEKEAERVINADGCYVMPGFIDMHVHFRDPGLEQKEDIYTGMQAAAHGGYTTVLTMPNTKPVADNPDIINYVHNKAKSGNCIHVLQVGAVTKGQQGKELADIEGMVKAGSPAISEDGKSVMNTALCKEAMRIAAECGVPFFDHCEDIDLRGDGCMNEDENAKRLGLPGICNAVEDTITARDIILALETGVHLHLCHCSTYGDAQMMKIVKEKGYDNITAEVCPHHFILSSDDIKTDDPNYKMNPPLRTPKDVEALKQGLKDGTIEVISTDHAPHSAQEKTGSMKNAPFGIVGLETSLPLTYTELVEKDVITLKQMVEKMCLNPAKILGLDRGTLQKGHPADVIIVDTEQEYAIDKNKFVSKGHNTPFDGWKVKGKVLYTICDGKIVFNNQEEKES